MCDYTGTRTNPNVCIFYVGYFIERDALVRDQSKKKINKKTSVKSCTCKYNETHDVFQCYMHRIYASFNTDLLCVLTVCTMAVAVIMIILIVTKGIVDARYQ